MASPNNSLEYNSFGPAHHESALIRGAEQLERLKGELTTDSRFDRHFGTIRVDDARVDYTITSLRGQAWDNDTATRIVVPGYFGCQKSYMPLAEEFALAGSPAVTMQASRHQGLMSLRPHNMLHPGDLPTNAAAAVQQDLDYSFDLRFAHMIGHSMAGDAAIEATRQNAAKDRMRGRDPRILSATLLDAAGITPHNAAQLVLKTRKILTEVLKAPPENLRRCSNVIAELALYGIMNPLRTVGEGVRASSHQIDMQHLGQVRELGVKVVGMFHAADAYFPADKALSCLGGKVDKFVIGSPAQAGHLAPHLYPREVAQQLNNALVELGLDN